MITERASANGTHSSACYSECGTYRYGLQRIWGRAPEILFVMLNPSTATHEVNDPTIERCQRRAVALGFGGVRVANLFAYRATRPEDLRRAAAPIGPENDALLLDWVAEAAVTLAAWGVHGAYLGRGPELARQLTGEVCHLGLTQAGHPRHPLYVPYAKGLTPWPPEQRYVQERSDV